ncbi:hypothetical protein GF326_04085 [Candidatus Bathyarchaeota archaeon]|nr:hypothetical protein [Candidatus Bathyarchaeota archaeon]
MSKRNMKALGLLLVVAIALGGISFVYAQTNSTNEITCQGNGPQSLLNGNGFWGQLTEEQRDDLYAEAQSMLDSGSTPEEIREMKASMLVEWGIEAPLWSGPHNGESGPHGNMFRDGTGRGSQYRSGGARGNHYNGNCPYTN